MVYRVPTTHSIVPSPVDQSQTPQTPPVVPWRGGIIVSGTRPSDRAGSQDIRVAALEIDGDRVRSWPPQFIARVLHERRVLHDVLTYVHQYAVPMCTFVADRHIRDSGHSSANELMFRNLSRVLYENETVAIAPWGTPALLGAGMIIYPAQNSSSLLVGALFFDRPFPDFLGLNAPIVPLGPAIPAVPPMHPQAPYTQGMIPASPYRQHGQSVSPHRSNPNSPVDTAAHAGHRQDQYQQYVMTYGPGANSPSSASSTAQWTGEMHYTSGGGYTSQQNPGQYP
ncbi:hypothetical protein P691DRAFT_670085 [Macrolepiota fuliginosa MF-IS2]|uniref:Uncharacterized protein n=1 Tax=Macrolepiota fuliginosa MF-IS2 TaxID=1400762 RepID=A0A9P5XB66_9AGAR|nr:hypothetical protein P691DRAFT_670085 [Macrolepiota fuliginosa MF-IS2]